jgi:hypothetical protein
LTVGILSILKLKKTKPEIEKLKKEPPQETSSLIELPTSDEILEYGY